jgi:hypothetical protein
MFEEYEGVRLKVGCDDGEMWSCQYKLQSSVRATL